MLEYVVYVLSVSLQMSGAAMVSLYWFRNKDSIIANEYHKITGSCIQILENDGKEKKVEVDSDNLKDVIIQIWTNRISFFMIAVGTLLGIFGEKQFGNLVTIICVGLCSICIIVIANHSVRIAGKRDLEDKEYLNMVIQESVPDKTFAVEYDKE